MNVAFFKIWAEKIFLYQYVVFSSFICYNSIGVKPESRKKSLRTTDNMKLPAAIFLLLTASSTTNKLSERSICFKKRTMGKQRRGDNI
ncbi:hypothetical protein HMPREF3213_02978 [Heyndrickxia coagulans]|uniref:Uncharacterized protein n=1 Tax=Heyndrickxia coagulans TaxID=1398 RepID=A0A133KG24_HEYCO|nr:hypothetical protein HMPREF3213_02978 [Heyndrickxia coagulans]